MCILVLLHRNVSRAFPSPLGNRNDTAVVVVVVAATDVVDDVLLGLMLAWFSIVCVSLYVHAMVSYLYEYICELELAIAIERYK